MSADQGHHDEHAPQHGHHENHGEVNQHGHRTHKFDPANLDRLLGPDRQRVMPAKEIVGAAGIAAGHIAVDLGSGPGYFTLPIAEAVGSTGRVYAADIQPELLEICARRAAEAGLRQVETVQAGESSVPLPAAVADRVFIAFVLHEADDQVAFLREARRLLKPGGQVAVVEWAKREGSHGPPPAHRVGPDDVARLAAQAGLAARPPLTLSDDHYLVVLA